MTRPRLVAALLLALLALSACQTTGGGRETSAGFSGAESEGGAAPAARQPATDGMVPAIVGLPPDPGPRATYRIGPYDLLQISVFQATDLSSKYRVDEAGLIVMPLIGAVEVGGLTPQEAQARIAEALGRDYLQNPQVSVFVDEFASQNVTVTGAVAKPGVFPIRSTTTLVQAIALAGGINRVADDDGVILFRKQENGVMQPFVIDLDAIQGGKLRDPQLIADDRVVVPQSGGLVILETVTGTIRGFVNPITL